MGTDQKTLFINWELYIEGCTLSDPSGISVIHTEVAAILKLYALLLDRKLSSWLNGDPDAQSFSKMPGPGSPMLTLFELLSS